MEVFITGLILFSILHLIPSLHEFRGNLVNTLGDKKYKVIFSIVSLLSFALIIYGFREADEMPLFTPPSWGTTVTMILMLPAVYLFMSSSAGSVPSTAQAVTAHPLSWGVVLWSIGHLFSSGEATAVALFSAFLVISISSILTGKRRGLKPRKEFRPSLSKELVFLVMVAGAYSVLIWGHRYIAGVKLI